MLDVEEEVCGVQRHLDSNGATVSSAVSGDNLPSSTPAKSPSRAGAIVLLILGSLFGLLGLGVLASGVALAAFNATQTDDGYYTTPRETFSVGSYALTSPGFDIAGDLWIPTNVPFDIATFRLQATAADEGEDVFIGIAPRADVVRYLADVRYSEVRDVHYRPFRVEYRDVGGTEAPEPPTDQDFWTESASGAGTQEITWRPTVGDWSVVVMNADASAGVDAQLAAGVRTDLLWPVAIGLIVGGSLLLLLGIGLLIPGAIGLGKHASSSPQGASPPPGTGAGGSGTVAAVAHPGAGGIAAGGAATTVSPGETPIGQTVVEPNVGGPLDVRRYPAHLSGELDPTLSRGLWLVKWLLAIPHYIILALLWFAFVVTTIVAGFAILFTGRYPRALFDFNVGVLRWNWRVSFYTYSALGTDQYPPFTLARTPYPADFDVEYPDRLSNGLVLVKWWLLALPHLLLVGVLAGGTWAWSWPWSSWVWPSSWFARPEEWNPDLWWDPGVSLLGLLVIVAAVILLFTGLYPRALFDFVMGINRWVYRVTTYAALMRDEYPPFRLDQGPREPMDGSTRQHDV